MGCLRRCLSFFKNENRESIGAEDGMIMTRGQTDSRSVSCNGRVKIGHYDTTSPENLHHVGITFDLWGN